MNGLTAQLNGIYLMETLYLSNYITKSFSKFINGVFLDESEAIICSSLDGTSADKINQDTSFIINFKFIKYDWILCYSSLLDPWCVDYLKYFSSTRFEINYKFRSLLHSNVDLVYSIHQNASSKSLINSVGLIFNSAKWLEREIWDLYGIFFLGHSDLRRLLTDYGFEGYPFRKDFPLTGFNEVRYNDDFKSVVSEPIFYEQDFRHFNFLRTWVNLNFFF